MEPKLPSVVALFLFPALGGLLFGYDIGATSFAVDQMTDSTLSGTTWADKLSEPFYKGLVTSSSTIGAFLGSLLVFTVADKIGRKVELQIGSTLYFFGALAIYYSGSPSFSPDLGLFLIVISRIIYGFGIAFAMHGAPTYISEMSPPNLRGLLVSLKEAMIVVGMLLGFSFGFLLQDTEGGWRYLYGGSIIVSMIMFCGATYIPKSARWLLLQDRYEEALASVEFVFSGDDVNDAVDDMRDQALEQKRLTLELKASGASTSIFTKRWRKPLTAGVGLVVLQQITGQPSILSYAKPIFEDAGLASESAVLVGAFKLVATLIAVANVDKYGRKQLLYIGNALMLVGLITLTVAFYVQGGVGSSDDDDDSVGSVGALQVVILGAMFVYIGGYQVGFGPISWLIIGEIFPLEVRGQAVAFAVQMNFFWNSVVQFSFAPVQESIGVCPLFALFTLLTCYSIYFVKMYVPETKGLTLEEIERFFENEELTDKLELERKKKGTRTPLLSTSSLV
jgi:sugar porter (SP) family MFS transporter